MRYANHILSVCCRCLYCVRSIEAIGVEGKGSVNPSRLSSGKLKQDVIISRYGSHEMNGVAIYSDIMLAVILVVKANQFNRGVEKSSG
jgi:hypothetical protein